MFKIVIEADATSASEIYHTIKQRNCVKEITAPVASFSDPEVFVITATTTLNARTWDDMFCKAHYSRGYIGVTETRED